VSQGTLDGIRERIPSSAKLPHEVIPLGFEPADFDRLRSISASKPGFNSSDGLVHLSYVGTLLPTGTETLRLLLTSLARARQRNPASQRLRLHFFGTSNQSTPDRLRVMPVAVECGVEAVVSEAPARVDYLDALSILARSDAILLLGSAETHYTASKLGPALLSKRPLLALYNESSSVVSILAAAARSPSVRVVSYGQQILTESRIEEVACHLDALGRGPTYHPTDVDLKQAATFSAEHLSRRLAALFDRVAA